MTKPDGESCFQILYANYVGRARRNKISFSLSKEEFKSLTSKPCFYCEQLPSSIVKKPELRGSYIYNGLDRVDSSKGYEINNVVPCCKNCNSAKLAMKLDEFYYWVRRVNFVMTKKIADGDIVLKESV